MRDNAQVLVGQVWGKLRWLFLCTWTCACVWVAIFHSHCSVAILSVNGFGKWVVAFISVRCGLLSGPGRSRISLRTLLAVDIVLVCFFLNGSLLFFLVEVRVGERIANLHRRQSMLIWSRVWNATALALICTDFSLLQLTTSQTHGLPNFATDWKRHFMLM